jgi:DNA-binding FrmR family transcriptional regulator
VALSACSSQKLSGYWDAWKWRYAGRTRLQKLWSIVHEVIGNGSNVKNRDNHKEIVTALSRIDGQVKGIQKMVEDERYCLDIIVQIHAAIHALHRVGEKIFAKHIECCVRDVFTGESKMETSGKIDEIMRVMKSVHKFR